MWRPKCVNELTCFTSQDDLLRTVKRQENTIRVQAAAHERVRKRLYRMQVQFRKIGGREKWQQINNQGTSWKPPDFAERMSTESISANQNVTRTVKRSRGAPKGTHQRFKRFAMRKTRQTLPGAWQKRKQGGLIANERRLISKLMMFWKQGSISLSAAGEAGCEEMVHSQMRCEVVPDPLGNCKSRRLPNKNDTREVDTMGAITPPTMIEAMHAANMTIDRRVAEILKLADAVYLQVDSSLFGHYSMQSIMWEAQTLQECGCDGADQPLYRLVSVHGFFNAFPTPDKMTSTYTDESGRVIPACTSSTMGAQFVYSGVGHVLTTHYNVTLGMDGGGEGMGEGRGILAAERILRFNGRNGFLNSVFLTRKAFREALEQNPSISEFMDFHNLTEEDRENLKERTHLVRLDSNHPVMSIERILKTKDAAGNLVSQTLSPKVSMENDPLRWFVIVLQGCASLMPCAKHRLNNCEKNVALSNNLSMRKLICKIVRLLRNAWVWPRMQSTLRSIFQLSNEPFYLQLHKTAAELLVSLNKKQFEETKELLKKVGGMSKLDEACQTRWNSINYSSLKLFDLLYAFLVAGIVTFSQGTDVGILAALKSAVTGNGLGNVLIRIET